MRSNSCHTQYYLQLTPFSIQLLASKHERFPVLLLFFPHLIVSQQEGGEDR
jgi:hypothetical protein